MITREDILKVAESIHKNVSEADIAFILSEYPSWQKEDPTGNWNLVVENLIYYSTSTGTHDELGYEQTEEDEVFDDSEERRDFGNDPEDMNDHPFPFHTDGDGDDDTLLNFMG